MRRGFTLIETVFSFTLLLLAMTSVLALSNTGVILNGETSHRVEGQLLADRLIEQARSLDLSTLPKTPTVLPPERTADGLELRITRDLASLNADPPCYRIRYTVEWSTRERSHQVFRERCLIKVSR